MLPSILERLIRALILVSYHKDPAKSWTGLQPQNKLRLEEVTNLCRPRNQAANDLQFSRARYGMPSKAKSDRPPHGTSAQELRTPKVSTALEERSEDHEPFVDAARAAGFLSLSPRRVLTLARTGAIPAYPLGNGQRRVWRFRLSELASAVSDGGVQFVRQSHVPKGEI